FISTPARLNAPRHGALYFCTHGVSGKLGNKLFLLLPCPNRNFCDLAIATSSNFLIKTKRRANTGAVSQCIIFRRDPILASRFFQNISEKVSIKFELGSSVISRN